jgi:ArsR family transcriptional regulator
MIIELSYPRLVVRMAQQLIPPSLLTSVARRFKILSEPVRLQLLNRLHACGEASVQELAEAVGHRSANVSKHLRKMARVGLIVRRQEGLYAYYRIADPSLSGICLLACGRS